MFVYVIVKSVRERERECVCDMCKWVGGNKG